jgi:hypothetical protein
MVGLSTDTDAHADYAYKCDQSPRAYEAPPGQPRFYSSKQVRYIHIGFVVIVW